MPPKAVAPPEGREELMIFPVKAVRHLRTLKNTAFIVEALASGDSFRFLELAY